MIELPTAAVPKLFNVGVPPLPCAACDIKEDGGSRDDKNGNRIVHGNLPCRQGTRKGTRFKSGGPS